MKRAVAGILAALAIAMPAHAAVNGVLYATTNGLWTNDGLTVETAKSLEGLIAHLNAEGVDGPVELRLCADHNPFVTTNAMNVTADGRGDRQITIRGRTADDTAYHQVAIDADGGAFGVLKLNGKYCVLRDLKIGNTAAANIGQSAILIGNEADGSAQSNYIIDCEVHDAYRGIHSIIKGNPATTADRETFQITSVVRCYAHDNVHYGFSDGLICVDCVGKDNGDRNFSLTYGAAVDCISIGSGKSAFGPSMLTHECTAYDSGFNGISPRTTGGSGLIVRCVVSTAAGAESAALGGHGDESDSAYVSNLAWYSCPDGLVDEAAEVNYIIDSTITLTADPFMNAAGGNIALNNTTGGGAACKNISATTPDGNTQLYLFLGPPTVRPWEFRQIIWPGRVIGPW